jgi:dUTPase
MPKVIVSDYVGKFTLEFWNFDFMKKVRIKLNECLAQLFIHKPMAKTKELMGY